MKSPTTESIKQYLRRIETALNAYKALLLFLVFAGLYGYIFFQINHLSSAPPSQAELDKAKKATSPKKVSQATVKRLQSLQDSSQRTQALFNQARQNPFKE